MTDTRSETNTSPDGERSLASLLKLAGRRADIPIGVESRVRHRVEKEWRASTLQPDPGKTYAKVQKSWRRRTLWNSVLRWTLPIGVAASAVLAVTLVSQPEQAPLAIAATVSRVIGSGAANRQYPVGTRLHAGDTISTGPKEGLSLLLARSESLRIDANTEVRVEAKDHFTLLNGRIYADSGLFVYRDGGLRIDTEFGSITDVGTQFSVATDDQRLDVAVREGRVDIDSPADTYVAMMGERLILTKGQAASVDKIEAHSNAWSWVDKLTPELDLTSKSLLDFLNWAARETGRELVFKSDEAEMAAMRTHVKGSISGLTPREALPAILSTTTVRYSIKPDRIIIGP